MDELKSSNQQNELFSKAVRAGKRTYFFDVKETRAGDNYLTITESKKRFNQQTGKFYYEKHKLFLYREDFDKFKDALQESFDYIIERNPNPPERKPKDFSNIEFEDLGDSTKKDESQEAKDDSAEEDKSTDENKEDSSE